MVKEKILRTVARVSRAVVDSSGRRSFCSGTQPYGDGNLSIWRITKGFAAVAAGLACLISVGGWSAYKVTTFTHRLVYIEADMTPMREAVKLERAARKARLKAMEEEERVAAKEAA